MTSATIDFSSFATDSIKFIYLTISYPVVAVANGINWSLNTIYSYFAAQNRKIIAIAASLREDSYNKKLVNQAAEIARKMGAEVTIVNLKDLDIPFYDSDLEKSKGMPENAKKLRDLMIQSDGIVIATPEYNVSIPAVLKNAIDWATRSELGQSSRDAFKGKKFAIMGASAGKSGGAKALEHLRSVIEAIGGEMVSGEVRVGQAYNQFNSDGSLKNQKIQQELSLEIGQLLA